MQANYLTTKEAARFLRLSEYRVRKLLRERAIIAVRPGGRGNWRIPEKSLTKYLRQDRS